VRGQWGDVVDGAEVGALPGGAALARGGPDGGMAWVLAEDDAERSLGAAMAWADKVGAGRLHLLATSSGGTLARRAGVFDRAITVHIVDGTALRPAAPEPLPSEPTPHPDAEAFRALFARAGADSVVEGGMLRAEVLGLEVARVEPDDDGAGVRLAIGVGKHDRDAQREVRGRVQGFDALFEVVRIVVEHRVPSGAGHAAYHLSTERWLRSLLVRRPELVGAATLHDVPPPLVRDDLRQPAPAPAAGTSLDGEALLVVADAWLADGRKPRLALCVPEADNHRVTRDLAASLALEAEVVTVPTDWRSALR
jgi:hypothetical protein